MRKVVLALLFLITPLGACFSVECFNHEVWDRILGANVDAAGSVDYDGIRINKGGGNFYEYLTYIEIAKISKCPEQDKIAFWINTYNLLVVGKILNDFDLKELSEDHVIYNKRVYIADKKLSLNTILNRVIRRDEKKLGPIEGVSLKTYDPRIIFALADGTVGGPRLKKQAFISEDLDFQLDQAAYRFINNPKNMRIEEGNLVASRFFQRHKEDFEEMGGMLAFLIKMTDSEYRSNADAIKAKLKTDYPDKTTFEYDWTVNALSNKKK